MWPKGGRYTGQGQMQFSKVYIPRSGHSIPVAICAGSSNAWLNTE
jgi:hypothetical protein